MAQINDVITFSIPGCSTAKFGLIRTLIDHEKVSVIMMRFEYKELLIEETKCMNHIPIMILDCPQKRLVPIKDIIEVVLVLDAEIFCDGRCPVYSGMENVFAVRQMVDEDNLSTANISGEFLTIFGGDFNRQRSQCRKGLSPPLMLDMWSDYPQRSALEWYRFRLLLKCNLFDALKRKRTHAQGTILSVNCCKSVVGRLFSRILGEENSGFSVYFGNESRKIRNVVVDEYIDRDILSSAYVKLVGLPDSIGLVKMLGEDWSWSAHLSDTTGQLCNSSFVKIDMQQRVEMTYNSQLSKLSVFAHVVMGRLDGFVCCTFGSRSPYTANNQCNAVAVTEAVDYNEAPNVIFGTCKKYNGSGLVGMFIHTHT
jgi:hypothetical protein